MTDRELQELRDDDLAELARKVEQEKQRRRRGLRRMNWNPEQRKWEKRAL